jgi:hypothetical protein
VTAEDEILTVVRAHCEAVRRLYTPDVILNEIFIGDDAADLIYEAADRIGLSRKILEQVFPFDTYFDPELPFCPPWYMVLMIGRYLGFASFQEKPPLTARAFAVLLANLQGSANQD